jgi:hypothetical protein
MSDEIKKLRRRIDRLNREIAVRILGDLTGGTVTEVNERYIVRKGVRLIVQYSGLNLPVPGRKTKRWSWNVGRRRFDNLVLAGEVDTRYQDRYKEPASPYVFFDIPRAHLSKVMQPSRHMIQISTNPKNAKANAARLLYDKFQVTPVELESRYL